VYAQGRKSDSLVTRNPYYVVNKRGDCVMMSQRGSTHEFMVRVLSVHAKIKELNLVN